MRINREAWSPEEDAILREKALAERAVVEIARVVGRTEFRRSIARRPTLQGSYDLVRVDDEKPG